MTAEHLAVAGLSGGAAFAYFVASLLSSAGFVFGFLLLLLPGLWLAARWSLVPPMIVGRGLSMSEAFGESWRSTRATQWTIVGFVCLLIVALVVPLALLGGAVGVIVATSPGGEDWLAAGAPLSALINGVSNVGSGLSYCSFVALFALVVEGAPDNQDIFA